MIDRQYGNLVFECDACGDTLETDTSNFEEANTSRRDFNWIAEKVGKDWVHYCSEDCRRKM